MFCLVIQSRFDGILIALFENSMMASSIANRIVQDSGEERMVHTKKQLNEMNDHENDGLSRFRSRLSQLFDEHRLHGTCDVTAERRGRWTVLSGKVDSHLTKARLLGLAPKKDGAQFIIDRLRVGSVSMGNPGAKRR
jgi:hypothetical protein